MYCKVEGSVNLLNITRALFNGLAQQVRAGRLFFLVFLKMFFLAFRLGIKKKTYTLQGACQAHVRPGDGDIASKSERHIVQAWK